MPKSNAPAPTAATSSPLELRLDWCTHEAAKYAVETWHYSHRMPMPPLVKVGVWERGKFIGCVLFARGASPHLGRPYGLTPFEVCELVRIALTKHETPVSRIVAIAIKFLRKNSPNLRLIVSFADTRQGHHGGIYQAGNWIYAGRSAVCREFYHEGRWKHNREVSGGAFGGSRRVADPSKLPQRKSEGKYRYLLPLDKEMRLRLEHLALPYPKRSEPITRDKQAMAGSTGTAEG
ncbi:Mom family adenine methylcarbamoylation protein [Cupriavidus alkaliphilus]|uniref:Mom family adenine methylcarbamoylation protein n=1 Tax=Cupriavidus alkaliphilus TaxID=942866 RepID=UPI001616A969|nr:protein Mom [Cupriavidus alkaliphilus]